MTLILGKLNFIMLKLIEILSLLEDESSLAPNNVKAVVPSLVTVDLTVTTCGEAILTITD